MHNHITQEERKLLSIFRQLNKDGRQTLLTRAGDMLEIRRYTQEPGEIIEFRRPKDTRTAKSPQRTTATGKP